jgi:hypothetical protein
MRQFFVFILWITFVGGLNAGERIAFADDKLSIELPDGWRKSERNPGTTMAGWESSDATASVFFQKMTINSSIEMVDILNNLVDSFVANEGMKLNKVDRHRTGVVNGSDKKYPAIYTTMDVTLRAKPNDFDIKFYLFVFDAGDTQYFMQGSCVKPIRAFRENQMMSLIRSLVVKK